MTCLQTCIYKNVSISCDQSIKMDDLNIDLDMVSIRIGSVLERIYKLTYLTVNNCSDSDLKHKEVNTAQADFSDQSY